MTRGVTASSLLTRPRVLTSTRLERVRTRRGRVFFGLCLISTLRARSLGTRVTDTSFRDRRGIRSRSCIDNSRRICWRRAVGGGGGVGAAFGLTFITYLVVLSSTYRTRGPVPSVSRTFSGFMRSLSRSSFIASSAVGACGVNVVGKFRFTIPKGGRGVMSAFRGTLLDGDHLTCVDFAGGTNSTDVRAGQIKCNGGGSTACLFNTRGSHGCGLRCVHSYGSSAVQCICTLI